MSVSIWMCHGAYKFRFKLQTSHCICSLWYHSKIKRSRVSHRHHESIGTISAITNEHVIMPFSNFVEILSLIAISWVMTWLVGHKVSILSFLVLKCQCWICADNCSRNPTTTLSHGWGNFLWRPTHNYWMCVEGWTSYLHNFRPCH